MDSRKNRLKRKKRTRIAKLIRKFMPYIGLVKLLPLSWFHKLYLMSADVCSISYDFLMNFIDSCLLYQPDRGIYIAKL